MKFAGWKMAVGSSFLAALLTVPMWGSDNTNKRTAMPGTLNYVGRAGFHRGSSS